MSFCSSSFFDFAPIPGMESCSEELPDSAGATAGAAVGLYVQFQTKIKNMLEGINAFYDNGKRSCLIDVFAIGSTKDMFHSQIKNGVIYWKESLIKIIVDEGVQKDQAEIISEDIIIQFKISYQCIELV